MKISSTLKKTLTGKETWLIALIIAVTTISAIRCNSTVLAATIIFVGVLTVIGSLLIIHRFNETSEEFLMNEVRMLERIGKAREEMIHRQQESIDEVVKAAWKDDLWFYKTHFCEIKRNSHTLQECIDKHINRLNGKYCRNGWQIISVNYEIYYDSYHLFIMLGKSVGKSKGYYPQETDEHDRENT